MATWFDTHCHLNDPKHFPDPGEALAEAHAQGVAQVTVIGINAETSQLAVDLAHRFPEVYATVGFHPNHAREWTADSLPLIRDLAADPKVVAIGEIGLDYHWDFATTAEQAEVLALQWQLAAELDLPVALHCREANDAMLDFIEAHPGPNHVLHCFSGDLSHAERAVAVGSYFGFDGPLTYPKSTESREVAQFVPRDRVLIETDAPYLSPVPHRGKKNSPANVRLVGEELARLWSIEVSQAAEITTRNARRFYRLA